jgi:hypothetical protein
MIITLQLDPSVPKAVAASERLAAGFRPAVATGLSQTVVAGAEAVRAGLQTSGYGLTMRHPASGLAASVMGWMIDPSIPMGALGVPANAPAARYATQLNIGGIIRPKSGKALAIPISPEAKRYTSPRDMPNLTLIPRKGKPPLLVEQLSKRGKQSGFTLHWVLVPFVVTPAFHWFDLAVTDAGPVMAEYLGGFLSDWIKAG